MAEKDNALSWRPPVSAVGLKTNPSLQFIAAACAEAEREFARQVEQLIADYEAMTPFKLDEVDIRTIDASDFLRASTRWEVRVKFSLG